MTRETWTEYEHLTSYIHSYIHTLLGHLARTTKTDTPTTKSNALTLCRHFAAVPPESHTS
jgi:hypothetical protein